MHFKDLKKKKITKINWCHGCPEKEPWRTGLALPRELMDTWDTKSKRKRLFWGWIQMPVENYTPHLFFFQFYKKGTMCLFHHTRLKVLQQFGKKFLPSRSLTHHSASKSIYAIYKCKTRHTRNKTQQHFSPDLLFALWGNTCTEELSWGHDGWRGDGGLRNSPHCRETNH